MRRLIPLALSIVIPLFMLVALLSLLNSSAAAIDSPRQEPIAPQLIPVENTTSMNDFSVIEDPSRQEIPNWIPFTQETTGPLGEPHEKSRQDGSAPGWRLLWERQDEVGAEPAERTIHRFNKTDRLSPRSYPQPNLVPLPIDSAISNETVLDINTPTDLYSITLETVHKNTSGGGHSSWFQFTNNDPATSGIYSLYFYWPNGEYAGFDGPFALNPQQSYNYNMANAPLPLFAGSVVVSSDQLVGGSITTPAYGMVTGTVYDTNGIDPIVSADVDLHSYPNSDTYYGSSISLSDGNYYIGGLEDNDFKVHVNPGDPYAKQWYNGHDNSQDADPVTVSGASVESGIDFILQPGGIITGTVVSADTGLPLQNINIDLHQGWFGTCTDENGYYEIQEVPYGDQYVVASRDWNWCLDQPSEYMQEYYLDAQNFDSATPVTINSSNTTVGEINFTLELGATLSGRVVDAATDLPIEGIVISVNDFDTNNRLADVQTDANGVYTVTGLIPTDVSVRADDEDESDPIYVRQWYPGEFRRQDAERIEIPEGGVVTGIDFALEYGGKIAGRIMDADTSQPLFNINIQAWPVSGGGIGGCTDSNGEFEIVGVPFGENLVRAGGPYDCDDHASEYVRQFYDGTIYEDLADRIEVSSVITFVTGIDFALEKGAYIEGRIYQDQGGSLTPLSDFEVVAQIPRPYDPTRSDWFESISTDFDGNYRLGPIPAGVDTAVYACADCSGQLLVNEYYDDAYSFLDADKFNLSVGETITNIDFTLDQGILITGFVNVPGGYSPQGIELEVWHNDEPNYNTWGETDATGFYQLPIPPIDDWRWTLRVVPGGTDLGGQQLRNFNPGVQASWDFDLNPGGTISGRITDGGVGVAGVNVYASSNWFEESTRTDADGYYTIENLPMADYHVGIWSWPEYPEIQYQSLYSWDSLPVILGENEHISGIDIEIGRAGQIEGYVEDNFGDPLEGVRVSAMDGEQVWFGYSEFDGYFSVDVPVGDYKVYFDEGFAWEGGPRIVPAFYPGVSTYAAAGVISVPELGSGSADASQVLDWMATVTGQITDADTSVPLGGLHIAILNIDPLIGREAADWTCTDGNGEYFIESVWPGLNQVSVVGTCGEFNYMQVVTDTFTALAGNDHTLNLHIPAPGSDERPFTIRTMDSNNYSAFAYGGAMVQYNADEILPALYTPLAYLDDQGQWYSDLLVEIPTMDNGGVSRIDGRLVVTYTLESGLLWSDGVPLTADDLRFTWQMLTEPHPEVDDTGWAIYMPIFWIDEIDVLDSTTAVTTYKPGYGNGSYLEAITYLLPQHALDGQHPVDLVWNSEFSHNPIGNGPYVVEDWVPGSHLDLRANPNYHKVGEGLPAIERMRFLFTGDYLDPLQQRFADVGLYTDPTWDLEGVGLTQYEGFYNYFDAISLNGELPFFQDQQVRQALFIAFDRNDAVNTLNPGYYLPADSYMPPSNPFYSDSISTYDYNPSLAASMLDAAGWIDHDSDGVRDKDGVRFEFDLVVRNTDMDRQSLAASFQSDMQAIGIDVNILVLPWAQFRDAVRRGTAGASSLGWGFDYWSYPDIYYLFHSRRIPTAYNGFDGSFYTGRWWDATNDSLLESIKNELDLQDLADLFAGHQAHFTENLPILPIRNYIRTNVAPEILLNFKPDGIMPPTWNIEQWVLPDNPYDLSVRKRLATNSPSPRPGEVISYTLTVRNLGYFTMTGVQLVDILPPEVLYQSSDPPAIQNPDGSLLWQLGDLPGESQADPIYLVVQVTPSATHGTMIVNEVQVAGDQMEENQANNGFLHRIEVREDVDLVITKYGVGQPAIGEHFDYYLNYGNLGGAPAGGVVITDTLPPEVSFVGASPPPTGVDGQVLTWTVPTLPGNQWGGQIHINADILYSGLVTNSASIASGEAEGDYDNNQDDHFELVDDILAPIITRPTSGVTDHTPTISGLAPAGSVVEIWDLTDTYAAIQARLPVQIDETFVMSTTATPEGTFSLELSLPEASASYVFIARSEKDGLESVNSNPITIHVDTDLPLDPDYISIAADNVDLSMGCVQAERYVLAYRFLNISAVLECLNTPTNAHIHVVENGIYHYNIPASSFTNLGSGRWEFNFHTWLGEPHSTYQIWLMWECDGIPHQVLLLYILVDPDGYVYDQSMVNAGSAIEDSLILNGVVTAYVKLGDAWHIWDASLYQQYNPQTTDGTTDDGVLEPGYYSFLTPSGKYRIEASAPGYQPYQSPVLTVITKPVHLDIGMLPIATDSGLTQSPANLSASRKYVDKDYVMVGEQLTYDIYLTNSGDIGTQILTLEDLIPAGTEYVPGSLVSDDGSAWYDDVNNSVRWTGTLNGDDTFHIQYKVEVLFHPDAPYYIVNNVEVTGSTANMLTVPEMIATTYVDAIKVHLPLVVR